MHALALHLAIVRLEAMAIAARHTPRHDEPHAFEPRTHGARSACKWCGGTRDDEIHTNRTPRPAR